MILLLRMASTPEFHEWLDADPTREPKNYEAAFYGFVRQHHQRNRQAVS